jgi:hypothetical protein
MRIAVDYVDGDYREYNSLEAAVEFIMDHEAEVERIYEVDVGQAKIKEYGCEWSLKLVEL